MFTASSLFRFREWAKKYGPIFTLKLGPANVVVLCDRKAIQKLLVEKGKIYSDRPETYVGRLLTKGDHLAIEQMDAVWREKRKIIAHNFSPNQLDQKHFRVQEAEWVWPETTENSRPKLLILFKGCCSYERPI